MKITLSNESAPLQQWKIVVHYATGYKGELLTRFTTKQKADAYGKKLFATTAVKSWKSVQVTNKNSKAA